MRGQGFELGCQFVCVLGLFDHQVFKLPDGLIVIHIPSFGKVYRIGRVRMSTLAQKTTRRREDRCGQVRENRQVPGCGGSLIPAGVVLRRDQHQPRPSRFGFRRAAKGLQDPDDSDISGENSEADGRQNCQEENHGHKKRDHGRPTFTKLFDCSAPVPAAQFINLPCIDGLRC
jgi:hypothetical protein